MGARIVAWLRADRAGRGARMSVLAGIAPPLRRFFRKLNRPAALSAAALAALALIWFWRCLPDPLFQSPLSPVLLARDGTLLAARVADDEQWRFPALATVPQKFARSAVRFEDKRFFFHPGVDPIALARAIYLNVTRNAVVSGASTISMQVIRLSRQNPQRTVREKLLEMILALRLELAFSKEEILALYASHAPFGGNVVGLEAASWRYFGRAPDQLSWAEACTLAVLPNSPALIYPGKNRTALRAKRDRLLQLLNDDGVIDATELSLSLDEPLPEQTVALPHKAPHLLGTLTAMSGKSLRFESTLNAQLQSATEEIVEHHRQLLQRQGIESIAVVVADNRTFEVLAYVGNSMWSAEGAHGHAVDVVRSARSTGSVLKPLLFAAMLQAGEITPATLVPDLPTQYGGYAPENYDRSFRGAVPARDALARSLNVPAVRMLKLHGVPRFHAYLQQIGMTTLNRPPDDYGLTLILGGAEGSLWDLTAIYANMADIAERGGVIGTQTYRRLKVLRAESTETRNVREFGPGAAWLTLDALAEVNRPDNELFWKNFSSSQRVAWKTGTSFGQRDGWAIGNTARYTVGVWAGNATGEGKADLTGLGSAAPLMFAIFNRLGPSPWFSRPEADLDETDVCKDDGYLPSNGCETVTQLTPLGSHFERASPYHRIVHVDAAKRWQVHGRCERPDRMHHRSWFVLPPAQEFYYRRVRSDYTPLPPFRDDCLAQLVSDGKQNPLEFVYPNFGTRIYIPVDLAGRKGRTLFEAVHRRRDAIVFWHLDGNYLGRTQHFHQQALDISPGMHTVTMVDQDGNRLQRQFEVLIGNEPARQDRQ